jgi:hypothetical protein
MPQSPPPARPIERRLRLSGALIALGVATQLATLFWTHPLSFMAFLAIGCPLTLAGVLLYLYSLATRE